jgi:hypothetical protein
MLCYKIVIPVETNKYGSLRKILQESLWLTLEKQLSKVNRFMTEQIAVLVGSSFRGLQIRCANLARLRLRALLNCQIYTDEFAFS